MTTLTRSSLTDFQVPARPRTAPSLLARIIATLRVWRRRVRERQRLAELTEYELHDFGASSGDRFQELAKPFWRG